MDLELAGRRATVSASSGGIGADIARELAAEGCAVLVHGRDKRRAEQVAESVRTFGVESDVVVGDLTVPADATRVAEAAARWETEILVNNAGPFVERDWKTATPDTWFDSFNGNVVSAVRLIQPLLEPMRERGWGRIINIGTRAVLTPLPNMVDYSAAKAAVVNMTTSLSQYLAGSGVTANTVSPGVIATDGLRTMFAERAAEQGWPADWADLEPRITKDYAPNPSGRLGTGRDIATAVTFLASPRAGYINGIDLRVDGGITGAA